MSEKSLDVHSVNFTNQNFRQKSEFSSLHFRGIIFGHFRISQ